MRNVAKWMLGAAVVAGTMGLAAVPAQAAEFRVHVGVPVAYVPPCPGAGYVWVAGYQANGYWIPGRWNFVGYRGPVVRFGYDRGPVYGRHFAYDRGHERFRR